MLIAHTRICNGSRSNRTTTVVCAGTLDLPIGEDDALTAEILGNHAVMVFDVGGDGTHHPYAHHRTLATSSVIIAVAGMEGSFPGAIAGLVQCPVIDIPPSIGYVTGFSGITARPGILNC